MLETPFGKLLILADWKPVSCEIKQYCFNRPPVLGQPITGCFRVIVPAVNAGSICCVLETCDPDVQFAGSSGESYLAAELEQDGRILTIGVEDEHPSFTPLVAPDGLVCTIHDSVQLTFGVAWADDYQGISDVRTWYAADPTLDK